MCGALAATMWRRRCGLVGGAVTLANCPATSAASRLWTMRYGRARDQSRRSLALEQLAGCDNERAAISEMRPGRRPQRCDQECAQSKRPDAERGARRGGAEDALRPGVGP